MCIAILNKETILSKEILLNSWNANNDGAGLLYSDGKKLFVFKELKRFDVLFNKYLEVRKNTSLPIVLHFRIATSGKINEANCHPFLVNQKLGFVHNGMIDIDTCRNYSDTYYFNSLLSSLPDKFINNSGIRELIAGYIGYSKLIFLNNEGEYNIINEDLGHWDDFGNWYSNESYLNYYAKNKVTKKASKQDMYLDDYFLKYESYKQEEDINDVCDTCRNICSDAVNLSGYNLCKECFTEYKEFF